jgi:hypothetical protein
MDMNLHPTFKKVCSAYAIDEVIKGLKTLNEDHKESMDKASRHLRSGSIIRERLSIDVNQYSKDYNALLIAKQLKASGITQLNLNPSEDLSTQVTNIGLKDHRNFLVELGYTLNP